MTLEEVDVSIKWPFKWCLVGSSGSGKTQFSLDVIANAFRLFDTPPSKVIIVYKEFQDIYTKFNEYIPTTLYKEDDIDLEEITKMNQEKLLIICDDLYFSKKINEVAEQFLVKGRHRNTSWIVLTQSIFNHTALKNISRNSTHITLFKSVRLNEPHIFFSQLRVGGGAYFIFVTTITTAGCVKKSVKCKIFQWIRERNCFDIAQNV